MDKINIFNVIIAIIIATILIFWIYKHYEFKKYKIKEFNKYVLKKDTNIENLSSYAIWLWFTMTTKIFIKPRFKQYKDISKE